MITFEELQESWRSQPVAAAEDTALMQRRFTEKWKKQQRRVLWSNIGVTAAFAGVIVNFVWVYVSFHAGRSLFFSGSLLFMVLLLLVYLWVMWKGISLKKNDPDVPGNEYIVHCLQVLYWRRKTITVYSWIYCILLWLALMCYFYDVLKGASLQLQVGATAATTAYIFGVQLLTRFTSKKKQLKKLDELIGDLKLLEAATE